jgi:phage baseplate assembly protein V
MIAEIREMVRRIADLERRLDNSVIHGTVDQVDYDKGVYRVRDGEFLTPWLPMTEMAGLASSWNPLEKGQQVRVISPGGEIGEQSWLTPGGYRDKFPAPSKDGKAVVRTVGDKTRVTERTDHIEHKVGGASINIYEDRIELKVGGKRIVITGDEIVTHGKTRLNNGNKKIHRIGDRDSDGDVAKTGADEVFA